MFAAAQVATQACLAVVRCGLKLSQMIAILMAGGYTERRYWPRRS